MRDGGVRGGGVRRRSEGRKVRQRGRRIQEGGEGGGVGVRRSECIKE